MSERLQEVLPAGFSVRGFHPPLRNMNIDEWQMLETWRLVRVR